MILEPSTSSGKITVTTAATISSTPSLLCSLILGPGSAASTVTVYDNASAASGTILAELLAAASTSSVALPLTKPIVAQHGITVVVSGTGATAYLSYNKSV